MSGDASAVPSSFSLVAWNIFQGLHHRSRRGRYVHNDELVDHLKELNGDVLVLPEAWAFRDTNAHWAESIADELGYSLHQWVGDAPSRPRDICPWRMVILTRIAAEPVAPFTFTPSAVFGARAAVRLRLSDHNLVVAGAHLYGIHLFRRSLSGWRTERRELASLADQVDVLAGDMNLWGPAVQWRTPDLRRAVHGRTYPSYRPHSQIDHVLVRDTVEVVDHEVLPDLGSDHRGVRCVLRRRTG